MSVTVGQLVSASKLLAIDLASHPGLPDFTNMDQDAEVAEDVLAIVAVFWPPAGLIEELIYVTIALIDIAVAGGVHVTPAANPIADAQTTESRGGRNP